MPAPTKREEFLERFPEIHEFVDCAGQSRRFQFSVRAIEEYGFHFTAAEIINGPDGYEFSTFSNTSPIVAFTELTAKIRKALAQRFLDLQSSTFSHSSQ